MDERRPNPDELLERVREEEAESARGKLTIFFGAAPGVGKTYTMLEAARLELDQKRDVVIGIVETHKRYDTEALVLGFELVPRRKVVHEGIELTELDLDAALARKPELMIIDELAHTNAPGSRHLKRWQDVEDLLDAGIDVYTTLNVQHLESLNDVIAQITGVIVRETVPDAIFDKAHDVRLVDLPVDELIDRLREGKVYIPEQAGLALENFFREGNLIALREIALRRTAERVDAQMRGYKAAHGIDKTWHTGERVLVAISASPYSQQLVRAARRMATSLHAELIGVYVETAGAIRMSTEDRERLAENMRLVERLGGDPVTLRADDAALEVVRYARKRNVTKIVVGKPMHPRWRDVIKRSFLDDVVRASDEIDVYVISGLEPSREKPEIRLERRKPIDWNGYAASLFITTLATVVAWFAFGRSQLADVVMVYLLGIVLASMRFGYGPSLVTAVTSVLSYDFFFVPPYLTLSVSDLRHITTFAVMFVVAVTISHLMKRIRDQADSARDRERRTASLYAVSRELAGAQSRDLMLRAAARHLREIFAAHIAILLPDARGELVSVLADADTFEPNEKDLAVVQWVWTHQKPAGAGTDTLPGTRARYVPLRGSRGRAGILALVSSDEHALRDPDERQLLETFCGLIGSAIERFQLAEEARRAQLRIETEQLRNALLSSISHDLRTPLAVVTGATSALLERKDSMDDATQRELLETAHEESLRLSRLVRNLLDMTRLEAGALRVQKEPQPIEEVIGAALNRLDDRLRGRTVSTNVPDELPLVPIDSALIEQVLINLIENAIKYTPSTSPIDVSAHVSEGEVVVEVADRGAGVAPEDRERVFEKFYRVREREGGGTGLGLTICRGIVEAHGGRIWVDSRDGGGAAFRFTLPLRGDAERVVSAAHA
jgi:two-component system sensor histidine kinase KdpD